MTSVLFALTGLIAAGLVLVVGGGALWVWLHEARVDEAGVSQRETLHENGSVVYDLARDQAAIQAAFETYEYAEGRRAQVDAAIAFVEAVESSAASSERVTMQAQKKLNRLRNARDSYMAALSSWATAAEGFPGNVAIRMQLGAR